MDRFRYKHRDDIAALQARVGPGTRLILRGFGDPPPVGVTWEGPAERGLELALVEDRDGTLVAVPLHALERGLSQPQFELLLATRDVSKEAFVGLVLDEVHARTPQDEARERVAARLQAGAPLAAAAAAAAASSH